jgi:hypothetical protein
MSRNRRGRKENKKQKNVIRCKSKNKPVFEHEVCSEFIAKVKSNDQNNCGNCKYAF